MWRAVSVHASDRHERLPMNDGHKEDDADNAVLMSDAYSLQVMMEDATSNAELATHPSNPIPWFGLV